MEDCWQISRPDIAQLCSCRVAQVLGVPPCQVAVKLMTAWEAMSGWPVRHVLGQGNVSLSSVSPLGPVVIMSEKAVDMADMEDVRNLSLAWHPGIRWGGLFEPITRVRASAAH